MTARHAPGPLHRFPAGHVVAGPLTIWCGPTRVKIAIHREMGEPPVPSCSACGAVARRMS